MALLPLLERVEELPPEERVTCEEAILEGAATADERVVPELPRLTCEEEDRLADDPEEERLACAAASGAAIIARAMTRAAKEVNIFLIAFRFSDSLI